MFEAITTDMNKSVHRSINKTIDQKNLVKSIVGSLEIFICKQISEFITYTDLAQIFEYCKLHDLKTCLIGPNFENDKVIEIYDFNKIQTEPKYRIKGFYLKNCNMSSIH